MEDSLNSHGLNEAFGDEPAPLPLFQRWIADAGEAEHDDPTAFALATVDAAGQPSVRMLLLKGATEAGFVFYTNMNSRKAEELQGNPRASMCFHWKKLRRQLRVSGVSPSSTTRRRMPTLRAAITPARWARGRRSNRRRCRAAVNLSNVWRSTGLSTRRAVLCRVRPIGQAGCSSPPRWSFG